MTIKTLWPLQNAAEGDLSRRSQETIKALLEAGYVTRTLAQRALQRARRREYLLETGRIGPQEYWRMHESRS